MIDIEPLIVEPINGKWSWPYADLEPGEWFLVSHADREPGRVRNLTAVTGNRLGRRFSVCAEDPDHPGFARVTRVDDSASHLERLPKIEYGTLDAVVQHGYGYGLEHLGLPFESELWEREDHQPLVRPFRQIDELKQRHFVLWQGGLDRATWSFHVHLRPDSIAVRRLPDGTTYQDLKLQMRRETLELMS